MKCSPHDPSTVYVKGDTVHIRDTVRDTIPKLVKETLKRTDTVYLPILIDTTTDRTVEGDSIPVLIPITSKEYKTDDYRAVVSGYNPTLDSMEIYRDNKIITFHLYRRRNDGDWAYRQDTVIRAVGMLEPESVVTCSCGEKKVLSSQTAP